MNKIFLLILLNSVFAYSLLGQVSIAKDSSIDNQVVISQKILEFMNKEISPYFDGYGFINNKGIELSFYSIVDLIDVTNTNISFTDPISQEKIESKDEVEFKDGHIYHIAPLITDFSVSHILYIDSSEIVVFRAVNCRKPEDTLENVLNFLELKLKDNLNKEEILERVKNYRSYGFFMSIDFQGNPC